MTSKKGRDCNFQFQCKKLRTFRVSCTMSRASTRPWNFMTSWKNLNFVRLCKRRRSRSECEFHFYIHFVLCEYFDYRYPVVALLGHRNIFYVWNLKENYKVCCDILPPAITTSHLWQVWYLCTVGHLVIVL